MKLTGLEKGIFGEIIVLLVLTIVSGIFAVKGCSQLSNEVSEHGVKSIVNDVWNGKDESKE